MKKIKKKVIIYYKIMYKNIKIKYRYHILMKNLIIRRIY